MLYELCPKRTESSFSWVHLKSYVPPSRKLLHEWVEMVITYILVGFPAYSRTLLKYLERKRHERLLSNQTWLFSLTPCKIPRLYGNVQSPYSRPLRFLIPLRIQRTS